MYKPVMNENTPGVTSGQRGPTDHTIREQIILEANLHFSENGYGKTTVSELAKAIGFSKAYIYKFFESKEAIGMAICSQILGSIYDKAVTEVASGSSATDRLRRLFRTITTESVHLFFHNKQLYDIAIYSHSEKWPSSERYLGQIQGLLQDILLEGRASGEFERKTPLDETCRSIIQVMQPFMHPLMLQHNLEQLPDSLNEVTSLVLRSLAP